MDDPKKLGNHNQLGLLVQMFRLQVEQIIIVRDVWSFSIFHVAAASAAAAEPAPNYYYYY